MTNTETQLDFRLPDFTRYSWVSDRARATWEPRIGQILECWLEIEWKSVAEDLRKCTLRVLSPEALVEVAPTMAKLGLAVLPLKQQGVSTQPYSNTETAYQPGAPFVYHAVIGKPTYAAEFQAAYHAGNQDTIGQLLGYPDCCRRFFQRVWVDEQRIDTTWSMAINTQIGERDGLLCKVGGSHLGNILLRWLGIRAVPHLPCAFDCESTNAQATSYIDLGRRLGFEMEMGWLEEMLAWPVEWTALHGIAEIKTPVVKIASRTDATAEKCVVQRPGTSYPVEGAQGLVFPYQQPIRLTISDSRSFQRGLEHVLPKTNGTGGMSDWYYRDNGFLTLQDMNLSHQPILELVKSTLHEVPANVLDLGCGNGALLKKIRADNEQVIPFGIDRNSIGIAHAHELLPEHIGNFVVGDIFDSDELWASDRRYALVILMPGRLLEASSQQAEFLLTQIRSHCDTLVVYAYDDWLTQYGGLDRLSELAGISVLANASGLKVSLAEVADTKELHKS